MTDVEQAGELTLQFTEDPRAFLDAVEAHLAADPVLTTVVSTVTHRVLAEDARGVPAPDHPRWWVVVRRGDEVVGVAMRTAPFAPYPLFVLPMPEAGARAIAQALHDRGEEVGGVNGALPAAEVLAAEAARLVGAQPTVHEHTRLFELGELIEPAPVEGRLRLAREDDLDLAVAWFRAFSQDAAEQAGHPALEGEHFTWEDMAVRIESGRVWFWEDATGQRVHLTGANPPSFGVARIGPVYTPKEQRGRGYASAAVAEVSRRLLAEGTRVCLFTDQANPTSNRIYQQLGFRPVVDMANLLVDAAAPA
ncbi:MAG TPA: GNAT family N-acetyltransferase [Nocardioides sp.]|nr:GNAT family N-acetyltransferase [Nocardioides sp.]